MVAQSSVQGSQSTGSLLIAAALHVRRWDTSHTEKGEGKMWEFCQVCGHWEEGIGLMNFSALMILVKPKPRASECSRNPLHKLINRSAQGFRAGIDSLVSEVTFLAAHQGYLTCTTCFRASSKVSAAGRQSLVQTSGGCISPCVAQLEDAGGIDVLRGLLELKLS